MPLPIAPDAGAHHAVGKEGLSHDARRRGARSRKAVRAVLAHAYFCFVTYPGSSSDFDPGIVTRRFCADEPNQGCSPRSLILPSMLRERARPAQFDVWLRASRLHCALSPLVAWFSFCATKHGAWLDRYSKLSMPQLLGRGAAGTSIISNRIMPGWGAATRSFLSARRARSSPCGGSFGRFTRTRRWPAPGHWSRAWP